MKKLRLLIHDALTALRYWQIVALGFFTVAAAMVLLHLAAAPVYAAAGPENIGWVLAGHIAAGAAVGWFVPSPFIDAYLYKQAMAAYAAAWKHLLDTLSEGPCEDGCELPNETGDCGDTCLKDPNA